MKIIITDTNWADEMDIWGFEIIQTQKIYEACLEVVKLYYSLYEDITLGVGSNEDVIITERKFNSVFTFKDINTDEFNTLIKIFTYSSQGISLFDKAIDSMLDIIAQTNEAESDRLFNIIYEE